MMRSAKIFITFFFLIVFISTCSKSDHFQLYGLKKPNAMNVYCQSAPNDAFKRVEYEYNRNDLINERVLLSGQVQSETTYEYNLNHQITKEIIAFGRTKTIKYYIYNDQNQLMTIRRESSETDASGQVIIESAGRDTFEYENNHLVKETQFWGGSITYEYEGGQLSKKTTHTKYGSPHHITTYQYLDDLLVVEKKETWLGHLLYYKTFSYDSRDRLIRIEDGGNIIEENVYDEEELLMKKQYYFGIDPCHALCCGNYIYRYEY